MNEHRFTTVRIAASWVLALGLAAVMLFSAVSPAYAGTGGIAIVSVTVGGPSGTMTYGTPGDVSYLVTATCGGTGGGNTWAPIVSSPLPAGVTASFSPTPLTWPNNCGTTLSQNTTLTLHSTSATPGGVSTFTVQVGSSSGPGSLTVNGILLNVVGFNAQNKPYDGNTIAIPILSGVGLSTGVVSPDQVFLDSTNIHASFASKSVANNKQVTASGFALTGAQASNYTLVQPTTFANITQRDLHIYIDTVQSKVYDGTNAAVVTLTTDAVPGDNVTATGTGTFDNKNAGLSKLVTVPVVSLSGPDAGNYNPVTTTATAQANISQRALTVTAVASSKQYDGSTSSAATPIITSGALQGGDTAGFIETFDTKNVSSGKILTPSGGVADGNGGLNYAVNFVSNSNGVIALRPLTVSALGINKTYDGTATASVALTDDHVFGDQVTDSYTSAAFTDKNVGTAKGINVSGISISGADAGNYGLVNTSASATANIGTRSITVTASSNSKAYDGSVSAAAAPSITSGSLASGDALNFAESYSDKNVGSGKTLTPSGFVIDGNSGNNYNVTLVSSPLGEITQRSLTVSASGISKVYDAGTAASVTLSDNRISGDNLTDSHVSALFADKNVGVGKAISVGGISISGADAANYSLSSASASASADITARAITVSAVAASKQYDGTPSSSAMPQITAGALQGSDAASFSEAFSNKNAGSGKTLVPSGSVNDGNGGNNYNITFQSNFNGEITARPLSVSAVAANKVYDGTTAASVSLSDTRVLGDVLSDSYNSAAFADRNVGSGKAVSVSGISISGTDAGNYSLSNTTASSSADITARAITVSAVSNTKVYDGGFSALGIPGISFGSLGAGDVANFSEAYSDKYAGTAKVLVPSGSVNDGNGGNNYSISFANDFTGVIQPKPISTVTADNQNILATDSLPSAFTFQYKAGDLVAGDSPSDIDTPPSCGVSVTAPVPAGAYPISCSGGADANYDFSATNYVDGTLLVTGVNDPPTDIYVSGSNNSTPLTPMEFQRAGTLIGMLTDQDPNGGDIATYSLVSDDLSCNGADNGIFQVSGSGQDQLIISNLVPGSYALDYETQPVLHICLRATDSHSATLDKAFTVNVQNRVGVQVIYASQASYDGFVLESALPANAGKGGSANSLGGTLNVGDTKAGKQYRSVLSFNTSALPDNAVLTSVTLKIRLQKKVGNISGLGNLIFDVKQPFFGTQAALQAGDFQNIASIPALGSATPVCSNPLDPNCTWYSFSLNPATLNTDATRKGTTQIRMEFANPTNNTDLVKVSDMLQFYSGNATVAGNRPQLVVEYSLPSVTATLTSDATLDGQVMESPALTGVGASFNATGTTMLVGDNKANQEIKSILSFNTAVLPDRAIITGVQLKIKRAGIMAPHPGDPFTSLGNMFIDVKQPFFGGGAALQVADFASPADHSAVGTISASDTLNNNWYTINLDPTAFSALTPKLATQLRLNFASEATGDGIAEALKFYTANSVAGTKPVLVITFSIP